MKKLLIIFLWFPSVFLTLLSSFFVYFSYQKSLSAQETPQPLSFQPNYYQMYLSHPQPAKEVFASVNAVDGTYELIFQYLDKYHSPMATTSAQFVQIFRQQNIDPVIPLAIAQCESNLGKKMPPNCHNPFGLGIHSQGTLCFENWEKGYEKMAQVLRKNYINKGLVTIEQIMEKYCPLSLENGGSWAKCVRQFIEEIETLTIRRY